MPDKKDEARGLTRTMLGGQRGSHELYVRVNALDTGMTLQDLAAVMPAAPDGIVLPKCRSGDDVRQLALWLDAFEAAAGTKAGTTRIVVVATETAESVFGLGTYKDCSPRLAGLMWGAEDLAASLGATENGSAGIFHSPYRLARDMCLMGAAAAADCRDRYRLYRHRKPGRPRGGNPHRAPGRLFGEGADPSQARRYRQCRVRTHRGGTRLGRENRCGLCGQSRSRHASSRRQDDRQAAFEGGQEDAWEFDARFRITERTAHIGTDNDRSPGRVCIGHF